MTRPQSKSELAHAATENFAKLFGLIDSLSQVELETPFDFAGDPRKKEAHWKRDKNLRDILVHLYEWHQLLLRWVEANLAGNNQTFLPAPYNWRTYGEMNLALWEKHQTTTVESAMNLVRDSHASVMKCLEQFTNDELFSKNAFDWVGGSTLGSYFVSATTSHYVWAMAKLKA